MKSERTQHAESTANARIGLTAFHLLNERDLKFLDGPVEIWRNLGKKAKGAEALAVIIPFDQYCQMLRILAAWKSQEEEVVDEP